MIAVDTNILVYAHREDSVFHKQGIHCIKELVESGKDWAIPWPCIHEFIAIVTHPKIYKPPTPLKETIIQVEYLLKAPKLYLIGEVSNNYWQKLKKILEKGQIVGPLVHDARIAAICLENNIKKLWTTDRDFSRFPGVKVENPLIKH